VSECDVLGRSNRDAGLGRRATSSIWCGSRTYARIARPH